jgi:hypothetical protein
MDDIMEVLHLIKKGGLMNTFDKFYVYKEIMLDSQINKCTVKPNTIFNTVIQSNMMENTCHCKIFD